MATENDLYICLCYIIPDGSTTLSYMDKAWQTLQQDIAKYSQLGKIILTGDLNARTGSLPDYIENDSCDYLPLPEDYEVDEVLPRASKDKAINENGKELIDLCISANLRIANGRLHDDAQIGNFTCCSYSGNSVVDYLAVDQTLIYLIQSFSIQPQTIESDHCAITFSLSVHKDHGTPVPIQHERHQEEMKRLQNAEVLSHLPESFNECDQVFQELHKQLSEISPLTAMKKFTDLFTSQLNLKPMNRKKRRKAKVNQPWFDTNNYCKERKKQLQSALACKIYDPNNPQARKEY